MAQCSHWLAGHDLLFSPHNKKREKKEMSIDGEAQIALNTVTRTTCHDNLDRSVSKSCDLMLGECPGGMLCLLLSLKGNETAKLLSQVSKHAYSLPQT